MRMTFGVAVLGVVAVTGAAWGDTLTRGKTIAEAFLNGDPKGLWAKMTPEMQKATGSAEALAATRENLRQTFGTEESVVSERVTKQPRHEVYERTSRWSKTDASMLVLVSFDAAGSIAGLWVRPQPVAAPSNRLDYRTKASVRLPFDGLWQVVWGGRTIEDNYHAINAAQRFALDLLVEKDGSTHAGDANAVENYHCWDRPILSPGNGAVVAAIDGLPDQEIGSSDTKKPAGNHVIIDFGNSEFGVLAHFRKGSIRVAAGEGVSAGQELGRCGNSGNSTEPHLHFHMQTEPKFGAGEGLPIQFESYVVDGKPVSGGEPVRGQAVSPM